VAVAVQVGRELQDAVDLVEEEVVVQDLQAQVLVEAQEQAG
jgi:hypothetical protein